MICLNDRLEMSNKIQLISELEDNWNSYGAEPFSNTVIQKCRDLLSKLPESLEIFPVADGSIQFEKDEDNGGYIQFNVREDYIDLFWIDPWDNTHWFPAVTLDILLDFLKNGNNERLKAKDKSITGIHVDAEGWAPNGHWCGECLKSTCEHCSVWADMQEKEKIGIEIKEMWEE